jgi:electron transfer flavoprotein beta subunit
MHILVPVKQVVDPNARVRIRADGKGTDVDGLKTVANPFDEIAVEEALRLREQGAAARITAVSVGPSGVESVLRTALALGADAAIRVDHAGPANPLVVARLLAALARELQVDLVLMGKQAVDNDCGQTGQMLSALLEWPLATYASQVSRESGGLIVTREIDTGRQTVRTDLPAVVTVDLRLNNPRFASLPSIIKARKAVIEVRNASDLDSAPVAGLEVLGLAEPPSRAGVRLLSGVDELVAALRGEGVI